MTTVATRPASTKPLTTIPVGVTPLARLIPTKLSTLRDGGTMLLEGQLNRSMSARVRFDGALSSPTRGQFFISTREFPKAAKPERPMTGIELHDLNLAITQHMANTPGRQADFAALNARIREAQQAHGGKVNVSKIPTSVVGPNANASVDGSMWINRMPGPGPRSHDVRTTVRIQGNGFNDAKPKYDVKKIEVYEKGTNRLVASFDKPKGTDTGRVGRGTFGLEFSLKFDESKVDLAKQYAVVFTTSINGSAPKQVRSEFMNVGQAF